MNPWALAAVIATAWFGLSVMAAPLIGRFLRNRTPPAPAASPPRAPGKPGAGAAPGPRSAHGRSPLLRPAPAPAAQEPRLLMSYHCWSDGSVTVDNHIRRTTTRFDPPPDDGLDLSDDAIERWLTDGV